MKYTSYKTLLNLNKKIFYFGFTPGQLVVITFSLLVSALISFVAMPILFGIGFMFCMILFTVFVGKKIYQNQKDGNPDYIQSVFTEMSSPKYMEDEKGVINYLKDSNGKQ